ncbi:hypothetical protein CONCODRAFT_12299 [Conidiobolus coronatus NRRL 28638]|uniref:F-box domain-containing protein n=1 Tax=Conidiobolus coronatus (strain ATCC 28846 / CBS 209.66 / NRRL 28638) TaxID=796925 RepID=A0A137NT96_CONC2|nr:hypothetical protein CONCODRAFT_12299 [Conidiobolus coronatus NRRL 28638]|eukprot:KXN65966.1 hypothetical protein CONCODRAFT_12299 [Conidiobolus coronatus NRRL 28638]
MTRVLRSAVKNNRTKENLSSKLSVCNNSKTIKKNSKKKVIANIEESRQDDIWNINSIRYNIFEYMDFEDFLEFNTVCKRWNNITNPNIHKNIKLQRCEKIKKIIHDKRLVKSAKTDAEVEMCIINNSKHAQYIKELNLSENLEPQRAIQLFETFKFIRKLTISGATMSQDQFIRMMIPLTQLQELNLSSVGIKKIVKKKFISEPSLLPQSLTKLALVHTKLYNNPELFIQTINSHTNLIEYKYISYDGANFLDPFFKNYPSLKIFEYGHQKTDYSQSLIKVFKSNAQLKTLKLSFSPSMLNIMVMMNFERQLFQNLQILLR